MLQYYIINSFKKVWTLCLVDRISVVILSLELSLVTDESLFVSLSSDVPFVWIIHVLVDQHTGEAGEVPGKWGQISLPLTNSLFTCWY